MSPTSGWERSTPAIEYDSVCDVGLRWIERLGDRALRCLHRAAEPLQSLGQALRERTAEASAAASSTAAVRLRGSARTAAAAAGEAAVGLDAGLDLRLLLSCRRIDLLIDLDLVAAGLHLGDDLGDRAFLVLRDEREALRHGVDARKVGDGLGLGVGEGQLRRRQEEVVHEMVAGVAELREVGQHRRVLLHEGLFVLGRQARCCLPATTARPPRPKRPVGASPVWSRCAGSLLGRARLVAVAATAAGLWVAESCTGRVTSRSVPTLASGLSTCCWASSSPLDTAVIATTMATPTPRPRTVRTVRPIRRRSSRRR